MASELGDRTAKRFDEICKEADLHSQTHLESANYCGKHKNFHSIAVILINIFASSVLFASIADLAPDFMKWIAAILVLISSSCAAINVFFKYPEREGQHEVASKRCKAFMHSCMNILAKYEDGRIDDKTFDKFLDQHLEEYKSIIQDSPRVI